MKTDDITKMIKYNYRTAFLFKDKIKNKIFLDCSKLKDVLYITDLEECTGNQLTHSLILALYLVDLRSDERTERNYKALKVYYNLIKYLNSCFTEESLIDMERVQSIVSDEKFNNVNKTLKYFILYTKYNMIALYYQGEGEIIINPASFRDFPCGLDIYCMEKDLKLINNRYKIPKRGL